MGRRAGRPAGSQLALNLLRFARLLRQLGVPVRTAQIADALRALSLVGLRRREDVYHALRCTLISGPGEMGIFNRAFQAAWRGISPAPDPGQPSARRAPGSVLLGRPVEDAGLVGQPPGFLERRRAYSPRELLRPPGFQAFTPEQLEAVRRMGLRYPHSFRRRRSRRLVSGPKGSGPDLRRSLRLALRSEGQILRLLRRRPKRKVRPLVALLDVSGSMEAYAAGLLYFLHGLGQRHGKVEVFLFATRLTRATPFLEVHRPEEALRQAAAAARDWAGGTRIGAALRELNRGWGRRLLGRGGVTLILSDGWDRGSPEILRREMARLAGRSHRLFWLNPLLASPGYEPLTAGMQAALPYLDALLPAHDAPSLESLARRIVELG